MLLTISDTYLLVLIAVAIQGSGEGLAMGTAHTYAMDLAPKDHRGSFLGVTMMFQALGAFAGPMFIGALYHGFSPAFAFATLAVWLAVASLAMGLFAKETAGPRAIDRASIP
jgi:MFS family permease